MFYDDACVSLGGEFSSEDPYADEDDICRDAMLDEALLGNSYETIPHLGSKYEAPPKLLKRMPWIVKAASAVGKLSVHG